MKKLVILFALVMLFTLALPLSAQIWNTTGSTGVIDEASPPVRVQRAVAAVQGRRGRHDRGALSDRERHPEPRLGLVLDRLRRRGRHGAAQGSQSVRHHRDGGHHVQQPEHARSQSCISHFFGPYTWNFSQKSYYLEVTLTRATATNPRFNRVQFP